MLITWIECKQNQCTAIARLQLGQFCAVPSETTENRNSLGGFS